MQRKYCVVTNKGVDVSDLDIELTTSGGSTHIPNREVSVAESVPVSKRVTVFFLTDEEAQILRKDERILDVELHLDEREDVFLVPDAIDVSDFARNANSEANWGLKRHSTDQKDFYTSGGSVNTSQTNNSYVYNNAGEGVDIFVIDNGIQADHPDFDDESGNSRVQLFDWLTIWEEAIGESLPQGRIDSFKKDVYYVEDDDSIPPHGTNCASIAAGKLYGWAKKSHIYSCKVMPNSPYPADIFHWLQLIKYFHENKTNDRPSLVSMSQAYAVSSYDYDDIIGGSYADANTARSAWTKTAQMDDNYLKSTYGILIPIGGTAPAHIPSTDALVDELIDAGVHFVQAAGNNGLRFVNSDHPEYDNTITFSDNLGTFNKFYNRRASPSSERAIIVGALDASTVAGDGDDRLEKLANFSARGSGVDIYASGDNCIAATSDANDNPSYASYYSEYPTDSTQRIMPFSGTSCACPEVAGVLALHLSHNPKLAPSKAKELLLSESLQGHIDTGDTAFTDVNSFLDGNDRMLFSKFNQDVTFTADSVSSNNINIGRDYKFVTKFTGQDNIFSRYSGVQKLEDTTGSFENDDVNKIYPNSYLHSFYVFQFHAQYQVYQVFLKFNGQSVYNGNWSTVEFFNSVTNSYVKLKRTDGFYNHVKQEFRWTIIDTNASGITDTPDNIIGIW